MYVTVSQGLDVQKGDNNKQIQYAQDISGQCESFRKSLPSFLDVLHCCSLAGYTVSSCNEITMLM